jgi:hypothetical protein
MKNTMNLSKASPVVRHGRRCIEALAGAFAKQKLLRIISAWMLILFAGCDLLNPLPETDMQKKIDEQIAYAKAPWVPVFVNDGQMGTASLSGDLDKTVKKGYSFKLSFQPNSNYPFKGWQAVIGNETISWWRVGGNYDGENRVKFVPLNDDGTYVEIFVYEMPPIGQRVVIGPWGFTSGLVVMTKAGDLGYVFLSAPAGGLKPDFPFTVSFQPFANYPFKGWQVNFDDGTVSVWDKEEWDGEGENSPPEYGVHWEPKGGTGGLEMSVTIV